MPLSLGLFQEVFILIDKSLMPFVQFQLIISQI